MAMSAVYTNFGGMLVYEHRSDPNVKSGIERQYVSDPLGSLVGELNTGQTVTYTAEYWPFGEVQTETGSNSSNWSFVGLLGYMRDFGTTLYVRSRHYQAELMRWLTVDRLWPQESAYAYVDNQATYRTDPSGMGKCEIALDRCLDKANAVQNACIDLVKKALSIAIAACRLLPKPLQFLCLMEAQKDANIGYAACYAAAAPLFAACGVEYAACLAAQCIAVIIIVVLIIAVLIMICWACPICCAAVAPALAAIGL